MSKPIYLCSVLFVAVLAFSQCQQNTLSQEEKRDPNVLGKSHAPLKGVPSDAIEDTSADVIASGAYLKAFLAAYAAFKCDAQIPSEKKLIENYDVEFGRTTRRILYYSFLGARLANPCQLEEAQC